MTPDAVFPIGSITKAFTATAAMLLVADEDIELDEPIGAYAPALPEVGARVTLRQLLSHTSGLASGPSSEELSSPSLWRYVVDHCNRRNTMFAPGRAFSYSNVGYVLVGHLIEMITGMTWWEAMESLLLRPLGIVPTFVVAPDRRSASAPVATGHSVNLKTGRTVPVSQSLALAEAPAGALALSARDLLALGSIHLDGSPLLPAELAGEMRRPVQAAEPFGLADGWGLGLALFRGTDTTWAGHDGNGDGTACYLRLDAAGQWAVAFTSNGTTGIGMWQDLLNVLPETGIPIEPPRTAAQLPVIAPPWECAGTYMNGDTEYAVARHEDDVVTLAIDGDLVGQLTVHDGLFFSLRDSTSDQQALDGRFLRDSSGRIDALQFGGRLARLRERPAGSRSAGLSA